MNINITEAAQAKIREFASANKEEPVVRIYVQRATCYEARFGIVIDSYRAGDEVTQRGEIKVLTDSDYIPNYTNGINIDYAVKPKEGFIITSALPITKGSKGRGSGGCSGGCSGCSGTKHQRA